MTSIPIKNLKGEVVGSTELDVRVWGAAPRTALLHQAVVAQMANRRRGTASTLTRGLVAGGGRKPRRQKGLGMARQGSIRSPQWRGGGVVFGPQPRDWRQKFPKRMRRLAMISALSSKLTDEAVMLLDSLELPAPRTKEMLAIFDSLELSRRVLIVLPEPNETVERASANIQKVLTVTPDRMNLVDVLNADRLVFTADSARDVTERLLRPVRPTQRVVEPAPAEPPATRATTRKKRAPAAEAPE